MLRMTHRLVLVLCVYNAGHLFRTTTVQVIEGKYLPYYSVNDTLIGRGRLRNHFYRVVWSDGGHFTYVSAYPHQSKFSSAKAVGQINKQDVE